MCQAKTLTIPTILMLLFCGMLNSFAQVIGESEAPDRPSQRWLPLPISEENGVDLSERARLLQQLRDMVSSKAGNGSDDSSQPKLSEKQLQQMEKALEDMREQVGEDKLPNLESIPKEWIDQALSDPIVREQARKLLEQYARDRKLAPDRTPRDVDGVPFPKRQPNDKTRSHNTSPNKQSNANANADPNRTANSNVDSDPLTKSQNVPLPNKTANNQPAISPDSEVASDVTTPRGEAPRGKSPNGDAAKGLTPKGQISNDQAPTNQMPVDRAPDGRAPVDRAPDGQASDDQARDGQASDVGIDAPSPPALPDALRIQALRQLFEKLKSIEGQRPTEISSPQKSSNSTAPNSSPSTNNPSTNNPRTNNPRTTSPSNENPRNSNGSSSNPAARSNPSSSQRNSINNDSSKEMTPSPTQPDWPPRDGGKDPILDPSAVMPQSGTTSSTRPDMGRPKQSEPTEPTTKPSSGLRASPLTHTPSSQTPGSKAPSSQLPRAGSNSQTRNGWPTSPSASDPSSGRSNSNFAPEVDLKTQLERDGLGRALQSIVEKTLKEQGESPVNSNSKSRKTEKNTATSTAVPPTNQVSQNQTSQSRPQSRPQSSNGIAGNSPAERVPSVSRGSQNPNSSSSRTGIRDMATQLWDAVQSPPSESSSSSAAGSGTTDSGLGGSGFGWSGQLLLLLAVCGLGIVLMLLLARKRVELAKAAREADANVAREILTEGIRTRADVVRAFHRFVLRRAQPVATWWNHRYVARRLTESSPQLKSVILDLASVYEHARYLPPEVALSSDEIARVQAALKQCAACSV